MRLYVAFRSVLSISIINNAYILAIMYVQATSEQKRVQTWRPCVDHRGCYDACLIKCAFLA